MAGSGVAWHRAGLTEFLPISSSAHLRIVGEVLHSATDPGAAFTTITQIGTEAAVLLYFRRDIWRIGSIWLRSPLGKQREGAPDVILGWLVILSTLPIAILGLLLKDWIKGSLRNPNERFQLRSLHRSCSPVTGRSCPPRAGKMNLQVKFHGVNLSSLPANFAKREKVNDFYAARRCTAPP